MARRRRSPSRRRSTSRRKKSGYKLVKQRAFGRGGSRM